nr:reverse transcriptase domain-containing protein [Tanacetum cinerariifolium]
MLDFKGPIPTMIPSEGLEAIKELVKGLGTGWEETSPHSEDGFLDVSLKNVVARDEDKKDEVEVEKVGKESETQRKVDKETFDVEFELCRSLEISSTPELGKLNDAIRKDRFPLPFIDQMLERLSDCIKAFNLLKKKLTTTPVMIALNWNLDFELMCDASDYVVRALLGQRIDKNFQIIYYASKTMSDAQDHYATTKKELLVVVYAFDKFWSYLVMTKTIVYTNHSALKYLLSKQDAKPRLIRWESSIRFNPDALLINVTNVEALLGVKFNSQHDIDTFSKVLTKGSAASANHKVQPKVTSNFCPLISDPVFESVNISIPRKVVENVNSEADLVDVVTIGIPSLSGMISSKRPSMSSRPIVSTSNAVTPTTEKNNDGFQKVGNKKRRRRKAATSEPKNGATNVGNTSKSSSMMKSTGNSSKKGNITTSNYYSALENDEEEDEEHVENVYDESANLFPNSKPNESSTFMVVVG